jgi:hypothetical protein
MNKVRMGVFILKAGKLPAEERDSRIGSKVIMNDFSSFKLNNKEDIEAFETEDIYGEEVTGKEGLPEVSRYSKKLL